MVYIPWSDYGICKYWMVQRCYTGAECKWIHPEPTERKRLWDDITAEQEEAEKRGIPRPQPPQRKQRKGPHGPDEGGPQLPPPPAPFIPADGSHTRKAKKGVNDSTRLDRPARVPPPPDHPVAQEIYGTPNRAVSREQHAKEPQPGMIESVVEPWSKEISMLDAPSSPKLGKGGKAKKKSSKWEMDANSVPLGKPNRLADDSMEYHSDGGEKMKEAGDVVEGSGCGCGLPSPRFCRDELHTSPRAPDHANSLSNTPPDTMGATKRLSNGEAKHVGPHPSTIRVSTPYMSQNGIEKKLQPSATAATAGQPDAQERSIAEAREDSMRLQGCTWIDNVRRALQLPIRTYTTACVYYHKFRLAHPGSMGSAEYGNAWADACAASLLTACKVEDTLKKSRDILAAAYNLKNTAHDQLGSDDALFEAPSRAVIGLERMVLEAGGFDFRSKYPHKLLAKIAKTMPEGEDGERERVFDVAWSILTDLHRTFAPLKQTSTAMALASLELAAHLVATTSSNNVSIIRDELQRFDIQAWSASREEIMETLLDLLDLYTQHTTSTILGAKYSLDDFLRIRLALNKECSEKPLPRHTIAPSSERAANGSTLRVANGHPTPVSPPQPETQQQQSANGPQAVPENGGTLRFMLNPQLAADEKSEVQKYFVEEWEEYEEEVEVPLPPPPSHERERERPPHDLSGRLERGERDVARARDERERERERLMDRERDLERERARMRDRERDDRRYDDRRFDERDRRYGRYDDRRFDDGRRRRDDRR